MLLLNEYSPKFTDLGLRMAVKDSYQDYRIRSEL